MKKQIFSALLCLTLLATLFSGCGGSTMPASNDTSATPAYAGEGWDTGEFSPDADVTESAATETGAVQPAAIRADAKLILTADLSAETRDFPTADTTIQNLTTQYGGYLESRSVGGGEGHRTARYTVRLPKAHFQTFLNAFGNTCNVVWQSQNAQDVGQAYFDAEAHLKTLRTKHERLLALLEQSSKMEDIIALENALSETEYEIEQYSTTLRRYDDLIGFSTIGIELSEVRDLTAVSQGNTFINDMQQAAKTGLRGITVAVKTLILFVLVLWPLLAIGVIVLAVLLYLRKRRRKNAPPKPADKKNVLPAAPKPLDKAEDKADEQAESADKDDG